MRSRNLLFAGAAALAITAAAPVYVGGAAVAQEVIDDDVTLVDPLIITTERRAQSLQDVPLAVTAFDDELRDTVGILTIQDMAQFTPGFSYNTSTDSPTIRGIGRQSNTHTVESPVANYFDGVYTSSVQDASRRPIFIERTEILRGPQGALSGKGSIAGAINTISKQPRDYFEAEVGAFGGDYGRLGAEATVTGPITDWLQGRANVGVYRQEEGFFQNVAFPSSEGDQPNNRQIYDLIFTGEITSNLSFFVKGAWADYDETRRTGASLAPYQSGDNPCAPNAYPTGGLVPSAPYGLFENGDTICGVAYTAFTQGHETLGDARTNPTTLQDLRLYASDIESNQRLDDHHNYILHLDYTAPLFDVKYIVGHQQYVYTQVTDTDGVAVEQMRLPTPIAYTPAGVFSAFLPSTMGRLVDPGGETMYQEDIAWYSNELQFLSNSDGPLSWVFGLFQAHTDLDQTPTSQVFAGYDELNAPLNITPGVLPFAAPENTLDNRAIFWHLNGESESYAVFGQGDYQFNDAWKFTLGLRYNKDSKDYLENARYIYNNTFAYANRYTDLGGGNFALTPISQDVSQSSLAGFALADPSAEVPVGATVLNPADVGTFGTAGCLTGYRLPDGLTAATGTCVQPSQVIILPSGVVGLPYTDTVTGDRYRQLETESTAVIGTLGVDFEPNEDMLFYARYARGYRPSGLNAGGISEQPEVLEETVDSYEVGAKLTLGGAWRVNTAAFLYSYKDIQQPLPTFSRCLDPLDISSCATVNSLVNLPEAESIGLEIEGIWMPTNNFQAVFSYGYLDTEITDGRSQFGYTNSLDPAALDPNAQRLLPITCPVANASCQLRTVDGALALYSIDSITGEVRWTQDLTGNALQNSPAHKVAANANYTLNFGAGDLTLSGTYIWQDEALTNLFGFEPDKTPAYDQVNIRAIWRDSEDRFQIIASVRNLFDEDVAETAGVTRRADMDPTNNGTVANQVYYPTYNLAPPRTFLVEVFRRF